MAEKSINYCCPINKEGIILLCEVAIGDSNNKLEPDNNCSKLPKGKHSTKLIGTIFPPIDSYLEYKDYKIPIGKPENETGVK